MGAEVNTPSEFGFTSVISHNYYTSIIIEHPLYKLLDLSW